MLNQPLTSEQREGLKQNLLGSKDAPSLLQPPLQATTVIEFCEEDRIRINRLIRALEGNARIAIVGSEGPDLSDFAPRMSATEEADARQKFESAGVPLPPGPLSLSPALLSLVQLLSKPGASD